MDLGIAQDMGRLRGFLTRPDIWENAAEESVVKDDFYPFNGATSIWLVTEDYDAAILVHMENGATVKIHPYIADVEKSRDVMLCLYKWLDSELTDSINKINAAIPSFDKKLYNFAIKVGFTKEGVNRASYKRGGEFHDMINLGMTRRELKEIING